MAASLDQLAAQLRDERSVISPHVAPDPGASGALGALAAAGPRAAAAPGQYALVVESVREGYLLHYASPRIVAAGDDDLALLAGDYLYALGLERLGRLGDLEAVRELSDLITLAARVHDGGRPAERAREQAAALWLACVTAIAAGPSGAHEQAKDELAADGAEASSALFEAARAAAAEAGLEEELGRASDSIDFRQDPLP